MKIQLKQDHAIAMDDGTTQNYFGVPFVCAHKDDSTTDHPTRFIAEWFADIPAKDAKLMIAAKRVDEIKAD